MEHAPTHYYVPHGTRWPIVGSVGLFTMLGGSALWLNQFAPGPWVALTGLLILLVMIVGWFSVVIGENERGLYNLKVDSSFRWGMSWFIFSEVMFFAVFFGSLFYTRVLVTPWLAGEGDNFFTNAMLWPNFENAWPSVGPKGHHVERMEAWGVPALNTAILLLSRRHAHDRAPRAACPASRPADRRGWPPRSCSDSCSLVSRPTSTSTPIPSSACDSIAVSTAARSSC